MAVGARMARCQDTGRRRQPRSANPDCFREALSGRSDAALGLGTGGGPSGGRRLSLAHPNQEDVHGSLSSRTFTYA